MTQASRDKSVSLFKSQALGGLVLGLVSVMAVPTFGAGRSEGLRDIRGPVGIPGDVFWLWLIAAAALAGGVVFWFFFMKKMGAVVVPEVQRPPWEVALEELAALEKEGCFGGEQVKRFYSRLSGIVRVYIERRFEIRAPEMTTEEFLAAAQASAVLLESQKAALGALLLASDLVKFAKTIPAQRDLTESLGLARRFVEETRIRPPVDDQQTGQKVALS
ncbi:MAG: hypothetical protein HGA80_09470 [Candidatus Omnitrophica bacterium]|nr:hypothetical protein [Candidatus Omnitrophota bacterium]